MSSIVKKMLLEDAKAWYLLDRFVKSGLWPYFFPHCFKMCFPLPVLSCRNGEASHWTAIIPLSHEHSSHSVCAAEVHQMSSSSQRRRLQVKDWVINFSDADWPQNTSALFATATSSCSRRHRSSPPARTLLCSQSRAAGSPGPPDSL